MKMIIHKIFGCCLFWVYRNPSNRTCSICGKNQMEYGYLDTDTNSITAMMYSRSIGWETQYKEQK